MHQVSMHLVQNGPLFKKDNITFNSTTLESLHSDDSPFISDDGNTNSSAVNDNSVNIAQPASVGNCNTVAGSVNASLTVNADGDEDNWNEVSGEHVERAGVFDTLSHHLILLNPVNVKLSLVT